MKAGAAVTGASEIMAPSHISDKTQCFMTAAPYLAGDFVPGRFYGADRPFCQWNGCVRQSCLQRRDRHDLIGTVRHGASNNPHLVRLDGRDGRALLLAHVQNAANGRKLLMGAMGLGGTTLSTWSLARQPPVLMAETAAKTPDALPAAPAVL